MDWLREKSVEWSIGNFPILIAIPLAILLGGGFTVLILVKDGIQSRDWGKIGLAVAVVVIGVLLLPTFTTAFSEAQQICRDRWGSELSPGSFQSPHPSAGNSDYTLKSCQTITGQG
jgi:hypothetical protein